LFGDALVGLLQQGNGRDCACFEIGKQIDSAG